MGLAAPATVQKLQNSACMPKPKDAPGLPVSTVCTTRCIRRDVLEFAYRLCQANKGCGRAGRPDHSETSRRTDLNGGWASLMEAQRNKTYRPQPLRRGVYSQGGRQGSKTPGNPHHPGSGGTNEPRHWYSGPIFEADLMPEQYAYRPGRGAAWMRFNTSEKLIRSGHPGSGGRGLKRILRHNSACPTDAGGGPTDLRLLPAASAEDVAGDAGGRVPIAVREPTGPAPAIVTSGSGHPKDPRSHRC